MKGAKEGWALMARYSYQVLWKSIDWFKQGRGEKVSWTDGHTAMKLP